MRSALGFLMGVLPACIGHQVFECASDGVCGDAGSCEPSNYCSFPDSDCDSGRKYGEYAADDLAGTCVSVTSDAGVLDEACVIEVHAGGVHSCALTESGTLACWGRNSSGELGTGSAETTQYATPQLVVDLADLMAVDPGSYATCAANQDGALWCWGENTYGQLGQDPATVATPQPTPLLLGNLAPVDMLSLGTDHACARLADDHKVNCWGANTFGEIGLDPSIESSFVPAEPELESVIGLAAGSGHTCAIMELDGQVSCWGNNAKGQLGQAGAGDSHIPVVAEGLASVVILTAGQNHNCAVDDEGNAYCWGGNFYGQAGQSSVAMTNVPTPTLVSLPEAVRSISAGSTHTCAALLPDGRAYCWGDNSYGQLGRSDIESTDEPLPVLDAQSVELDDVTQISGGGSYTCALLEDQSVWCWGHNDHGQLGDGTENDSAAPVEVSFDCP